MAVRRSWQRIEFLSTPSGWRATSKAPEFCIRIIISIHALRVEGDAYTKALQGIRAKISIHALRVEGDPTAG